MTYAELLLDNEWKLKREVILSRDEHKCQHCFNKTLFDTFTTIPLSFRTSINTTIVKLENIDTGYSDEVELAIKYTFISKLRKQSTDILAIIFQENHNGFGNRIMGICSLSLIITPKDIKNENDVYINECIQDAQLERKSALINYISATPLPTDNAIIKKRLINRYLKEINQNDLKNIPWLFTKNLHIHHKYYQKGKKPWEYDNSALVTLCWQCHENLHKSIKIPILDENAHKVGELTPCSRCYGAGVLPEYHHVQDGICFQCKGAKYNELIL